MKKIIIVIASILIFTSLLFVPSIFLVPKNMEFLGTKIGMVTYNKLDERLTSILNDYKFTLTGDEDIQLTSEEIGLELNDNYLESIRTAANPVWFLNSDGYKFMNDELLLINEEILTGSLEKITSNGIVSSDAKISFNGENYEITPEIQGTALNINELEPAIVEAILSNETTLALNTFYSKPEVLAVDLENSVTELNSLLSKKYEVIFGSDHESIKPSTIVEYINVNNDGTYEFDETGLKDMLVDLTYKYDSSISTSTLFETKTYYIDELTNDFISQIKDSEDKAVSITAREDKFSRTLTQKANTSLKTYVEVNISSQHLWYYVNGKLVLDTPVVTGNMSEDNWATPPGTFEIMYKQEDQVLNGASYGYDYAVPVEYWMPISSDGVGLHDGDWIPAEEFGTDRYIENGSHGCINLPPDVAKQFYSMVETGTTVYVTP